MQLLTFWLATKPVENEGGMKCEVCLTEIPATVAETFDGPAYMHYFCGLDCLGKWQEQQKKSGQGGNRPDPL